MGDKNKLTPADVAELLGLPLVTIQRWIHQGKIPVKTIEQEKYFKKKEILEWAIAHDFFVKIQEQDKTANTGNLLSQAIKRGGIYFNLEGNDIYSVFENSINRLPFLAGADKNSLLNEFLNREELASTGIGKGIAIPHTRNRLDLGIADTIIPVIFLKNAIEFNAIDGLPVQVLFMIFTANTKDHLQILSKISYLMQHNSFVSSLQNKNREINLLPEIIKIENAWDT
jgi:PTS system nitrogen regulatory IIA component